MLRAGSRKVSVADEEEVHATGADVQPPEWLFSLLSILLRRQARARGMEPVYPVLSKHVQLVKQGIVMYPTSSDEDKWALFHEAYATMQVRRCEFCLAAVEHASRSSFTCPACHLAVYCGPEHFGQDYALHVTECSQMAVLQQLDATREFAAHMRRRERANLQRYIRDMERQRDAFRSSSGARRATTADVMADLSQHVEAQSAEHVQLEKEMQEVEQEAVGSSQLRSEIDSMLDELSQERGRYAGMIHDALGGMDEWTFRAMLEETMQAASTRDVFLLFKLVKLAFTLRSKLGDAWNHIKLLQRDVQQHADDLDMERLRVAGVKRKCDEDTFLAQQEEQRVRASLREAVERRIRLQQRLTSVSKEFKDTRQALEQCNRRLASEQRQVARLKQELARLPQLGSLSGNSKTGKEALATRQRSRSAVRRRSPRHGSSSSLSRSPSPRSAPRRRQRGPLKSSPAGRNRRAGDAHDTADKPAAQVGVREAQQDDETDEEPSERELGQTRSLPMLNSGLVVPSKDAAAHTPAVIPALMDAAYIELGMNAMEEAQYAVNHAARVAEQRAERDAILHDALGSPERIPSHRRRRRRHSAPAQTRRRSSVQAGTAQTQEHEGSVPLPMTRRSMPRLMQFKLKVDRRRLRAARTTVIKEQRPYAKQARIDDSGVDASIDDRTASVGTAREQSRRSEQKPAQPVRRHASAQTNPLPVIHPDVVQGSLPTLRHAQLASAAEYLAPHRQHRARAPPVIQLPGRREDEEARDAALDLDATARDVLREDRFIRRRAVLDNWRIVWSWASLRLRQVALDRAGEMHVLDQEDSTRGHAVVDRLWQKNLQSWRMQRRILVSLHNSNHERLVRRARASISRVAMRPASPRVEPLAQTLGSPRAGQDIPHITSFLLPWSNVAAGSAPMGRQRGGGASVVQLSEGQQARVRAALPYLPVSLPQLPRAQQEQVMNSLLGFVLAAGDAPQHVRTGKESRREIHVADHAQGKEVRPVPHWLKEQYDEKQTTFSMLQGILDDAKREREEMKAQRRRRFQHQQQPHQQQPQKQRRYVRCSNYGLRKQP